MRTVYDLAGDRTWRFDEYASLEWVVAYAAADVEGCLPELFALARSRELELLYCNLPFSYGLQSVSLGDFAARRL